MVSKDHASHLLAGCWPFRCWCFFWQLFWWWQQPFWFEPKKERFLQIILRLVELLLVRTLFSIGSPTLFLLAGITHEVTNFTYNVFWQKEPKKKQKMTLWLWSSMDTWTVINFEDYLLPSFSKAFFLWFMKKFLLEK